MGILYYYACKDCKKWIELGKYHLDLTEDNMSVSPRKILRFLAYVREGEALGCSIEFEKKISEWFLNHAEHSIVRADDTCWNEPFLDADGKVLPGWKMQLYEFNPLEPFIWEWMDWDLAFKIRMAHDWQYDGGYPDLASFERSMVKPFLENLQIYFDEEVRKIWSEMIPLLERTPRSHYPCLGLAKKIYKIEMNKVVKMIRKYNQ